MIILHALVGLVLYAWGRFRLVIGLALIAQIAVIFFPWSQLFVQTSANSDQRLTFRTRDDHRAQIRFRSGMSLHSSSEMALHFISGFHHSMDPKSLEKSRCLSTPYRTGWICRLKGSATAYSAMRELVRGFPPLPSHLTRPRTPTSLHKDPHYFVATRVTCLYI